MSLVQRVMTHVRLHGAAYTLRRAGEILAQRVFHTYDRRFRREAPDAAELARQRQHQPQGGLISVAVPVYNTRPAFLRELAASLSAQTYDDWEAVLYDGGSTDAESIAAMDEIADARIRVIHGAANEGISGNTNQAIARCRGAYIAFCDHDDVLAPEALWQAARAIEQRQPDMIYSDEDRLTEDGCIHTDPHRKPDFCPDQLRSENYICHLMVVRREVLMQLGGFRADFDGSQDHDLVLRISEITENIHHIPRVLYHWRRFGGSMSQQHLDKCQAAAARAVTEHMGRIGYPGLCAAENGVLRLLYDLPERKSVEMIRVSGEGRYAKMNAAAMRSEADFLLFADESVNGFSDGFERELLMYAQRRDVAAVTPMLTDRRGRVLHAGYALTPGGAINRGAAGRPGLNRISHNVAAVSPACFMIRRETFVPFDEHEQDAAGMIRWCLRLGERGLRCVYTPHARAVCASASVLGADKWQYEGKPDPCCASADEGDFIYSP